MHFSPLILGLRLPHILRCQFSFQVKIYVLILRKWGLVRPFILVDREHIIFEQDFLSWVNWRHQRLIYLRLLLNLIQLRWFFQNIGLKWMFILTFRLRIYKDCWLLNFWLKLLRLFVFFYCIIVIFWRTFSPLDRSWWPLWLRGLNFFFLYWFW